MKQEDYARRNSPRIMKSRVWGKGRRVVRRLKRTRQPFPRPGGKDTGGATTVLSSGPTHRHTERSINKGVSKGCYSRCSSGALGKDLAISRTRGSGRGSGVRGLLSCVSGYSASFIRASAWSEHRISFTWLTCSIQGYSQCLWILECGNL